MDDLLVPPGEHCYSVHPLLPGQEAPARDPSRIGRGQREFKLVRLGQPAARAVLCPYWRTTDAGGVRCDLTGEQDEPGYDEWLTHFVKVCDINEVEDDLDVALRLERAAKDAEASPARTFACGDRVRHRSFGIGVITALEPVKVSNARPSAQVLFDWGETRRHVPLPLDRLKWVGKES